MVINKRGSVLLEVLVGLISFAFLMSVTLALIIQLFHIKVPESTISNQLGIKQLQWQLAFSEGLMKTSDGYCFEYLLDERCLKVTNNRLIMTPGTQIILNQAQSMMLFEQEGGVWVIVQQKERTTSYFISTLK